MREIKFRAWDGKKIWMVETLEELHDPDLKITMFTALHDKNGKEIWESDILRWDRISGRDDRSGRYDPAHGCYFSYGQVKFKDGCFWLEWVDEEEVSDILSNYCFVCEVIGNIYENPEFLK